MYEGVLKQIEADVVITLSNDDSGRVHPYWECEDSHKVLVARAMNLALEFTEYLGHGETTYEIYDFRELR